METKILKNEFNLGESGFYYVRMKFAKEEDMPLNWFDVFQIEEGDYITNVSYEENWKGNPEIVYTTHNDFHLSNTETFRTKEQALQHAKELNTARVRYYLENLMKATNFLNERELLDFNDRVAKFLMEINARFNAFTKTQKQAEGEE